MWLVIFEIDGSPAKMACPIGKVQVQERSGYKLQYEYFKFAQ